MSRVIPMKVVDTERVLKVSLYYRAKIYWMVVVFSKCFKLP